MQMPRKWREKEARKTVIAMGCIRQERPGKSGRIMENNNKRQKELNTVGREHSERTARKEDNIMKKKMTETEPISPLTTMVVGEEQKHSTCDL